MAEKFDLSWDPSRPVLREVLRAGAWVEADDEAYAAQLTELLRSAPARGFDMISDALAYTMQLERPNDGEVYDMLARAGCRRLVQVVAKSIISLQTGRLIRGSTGGVIDYTACATMEAAEALLA